jgi:hypothetical protein
LSEPPWRHRLQREGVYNRLSRTDPKVVRLVSTTQIVEEIGIFGELFHFPFDIVGKDIRNVAIWQDSAIINSTVHSSSIVTTIEARRKRSGAVRRLEVTTRAGASRVGGQQRIGRQKNK